MNPASEQKLSSVEFRPIGTPEEVRALAHLLDTSFPVPAGSRFFDDFPVWALPLERQVFHIGGYRDGALVCSASARVAELKTSSGVLPIGLIGAVATHASTRGQGLASHAVAHVLTWLKGQGVALTVLWGSEHDLYRRLGFELCGYQLTLPLQSLELPAAERRAPDELLSTGWNPALFELLQQRPSGLVLKAQDIDWVSAHKNIQWYWTGPATRPTAYAALGKGMDLGGLIHEWGGEPAALRQLLSLLQKHPGAASAALLGTRPLFQQSGLTLKSGMAYPASEYLCMAKVMDPANGLQRIFRGFRPEQCPPVCPTGCVNDCSARFAMARSSMDRDPARLLFGGPGEKFPAGLEQILPLPLWLWGMDGA